MPNHQKVLQSYPDGFTRRNVFGVPDGRLKKVAQLDAMLFGTAAHKVLQGHESKTAAMKYGLPESRIADLVKVRELFRTSKTDGGIVHRELKFAANLEGQRFQGKVDRIEVASFGKSKLIDFKTDTVKDGGKEKCAREHTDQLRTYSLILGKALKAKVDGQVYFTGSGKYVAIGDETEFENGLRKRVKECSKQVGR